jgi:hypothetical protein
VNTEYNTGRCVFLFSSPLPRCEFCSPAHQFYFLRNYTPRYGHRTIAFSINRKQTSLATSARRSVLRSVSTNKYCRRLPTLKNRS